MIVRFPNGAVAAAAIVAVGIRLSQYGLCVDCDDKCALVSEKPITLEFFTEGDTLYGEISVRRPQHEVKTQAEFEKIIPVIATQAINDADADDDGTEMKRMDVVGSDTFLVRFYDTGAIRVGCMTFPRESADKVLALAAAAAANPKRKPADITVEYRADGERFTTGVSAGAGDKQDSLRFRDTGGELSYKQIAELGKLRNKFAKKAPAKAKPERFSLWS